MVFLTVIVLVRRIFLSSWILCSTLSNDMWAIWEENRNYISKLLCSSGRLGRKIHTFLLECVLVASIRRVFTYQPTVSSYSYALIKLAHQIDWHKYWHIVYEFVISMCRIWEGSYNHRLSKIHTCTDHAFYLKSKSPIFLYARFLFVIYCLLFTRFSFRSYLTVSLCCWQTSRCYMA